MYYVYIFFNFQICRMLVELGASLDAADDNGQKAIHLAAQANQVHTCGFAKV